MRRARVSAVVAAALVAVAFLLSAGSPAGAQTVRVGERVRELNSTITIQADGSVRVVERIAYDFGFSARHGIYRYIPVRYRYDDSHDRVLRITNLRVTSPDAPAEVDVSEQDNNKVLRIGSPDRTITGLHTYVIAYTVAGALNGFDDHDELFWNVVGGGWKVPIDIASSKVTAPGTISQIRCAAGYPGVDQPCPTQTTDGSDARFRATDLSPGDVMTIAVAFPKGLVPTPTPILEERWSLQRAFRLDGATVGMSALLGALVFTGVGVLLWRGRDRRFMGSGVDVAMGNTTGAEQPVGLFENTDSPVEFVPPEGIRPGQVGTLIDETANPLDISATIVDLAVRGYLRIEQVGEQGFFKKHDWNLVKLDKSPSDLMTYERRLYDALFHGREAVLLSKLKNTFATDLHKVQDDLYQDMVKEGWYAVRPDRTRSTWRGFGVLAVIASIGISYLLIRYTKWALISVPLVLGAFVLLLGATRMPRRSARGTAMLRRVNGFRQLFTEPEVARQKFAENNNIFSEYLPYAIVFGLTEKWANTFEGLAADPAAATNSWYVSPYPFVWTDFGHQMDSFTVTTSGTITSTPASSGGSAFSGGGGFSGGGFGGGGGGSW